ncbi:MAG: polysaccharide deacetylase family protein [Clostridia bacterium]|nr:polysaccharide deacetylase family protein [Clostridia bacterium]
MNQINLLFPGFRSKAFTLSFDDGAEADLPLGKLFLEFGMKCTFNLIASSFAEVDEKENVIPKISKEKKEFYTNPDFEVASHGFYHPFLWQIATADACHDVITDRRCHENVFGRLVRGFAYPYGGRNKNVHELLRLAGFAYARNVGPSRDFYIPESDGWFEWAPSAHYFDSDFDRLTPMFLNFKSSPEIPLLYYVWGHSYEFEQRPGGLAEVRERLAPLAHLDEVWYATNIEVHDYVEAYRSLVFTADTTHVYNPTLIPVYFHCNHGNFKIDPGETVKIF